MDTSLLVQAYQVCQLNLVKSTLALGYKVVADSRPQLKNLSGHKYAGDKIAYLRNYQTLDTLNVWTKPKALMVKAQKRTCSGYRWVVDCLKWVLVGNP